MISIKKKLKFAALFFAVISFITGLFSCGGSESGAASQGENTEGGGAVARVEAAMQEELAAELPDFTCPPMEDRSMKVEGLPEEVVWITSYPKDWASKNTKTGGVYHSSITEYPTTYRTVGPESNIGTRNYFLQTYSLVGVNYETKEIFPQAATHWAFGADKQTVYYKLNENVKWSDGKPCTADDYIFMWKDFMLSPHLNDPWYKNYWEKREIKKINDYCISIKFLESDKLDRNTLLYRTNPAPRPKHFYNGELKKDWYIEYNWKAEPVTGPYVFDEQASKKGELLVFKRIENWWAREYPYFKNQFNFERLEYKIISGGPDIIEGYFKKGEIDVFGLAIPALWRKASADENITNGYVDRWMVHYLPEKGLDGIFFNTKFPLLGNKKVRQAMYYAFDIQGMIDQTLYGEYTRYHNIGVGHYWNGVYFDDDSIRKPDFNPDTAKALLAEAGYDTLGSDGILMNAKKERVSFELSYPFTHWTERLTFIKEQAKKAGVEIELKLQTSGHFNDCLNRKHQAAYIPMTTVSPPKYWEYFSKFNAEKPITNNFFAWWNPEMEELLAVEESGPPLQLLAETQKKMQQIVHDEALFIPVVYIDFARVAAWKWMRYPSWGNTKFTGFFEWGLPFDFGWMWIDEDVKQEITKSMETGKTYEPRVWHLAERYVIK